MQDLIVDEASWSVRYLIVDTANWWFGQHVLVSPCAVEDVDWSGHQIRVKLTQERIRSSPPWTPDRNVDADYERLLESRYNWS